MHNLHFTRNLFTKEVKTDCVLPHHRFGHIVDGFGQAVDQLMVGHMKFVVLGLKALGYRIGVLKLAAFFLWLVIKTDSEGFQVVITRFGQQTNKETRVQTTGQQHTYWHICDVLAPFDRKHQRFVNRLNPLVVAACDHRSARFQRPVATLAHRTISAHAHRVARPYLANLTQNRGGCRHYGMQGQLMMEPHRVE